MKIKKVYHDDKNNEIKHKYIRWTFPFIDMMIVKKTNKNIIFNGKIMFENQDVFLVKKHIFETYIHNNPIDYLNKMYGTYWDKLFFAYNWHFGSDTLIIAFKILDDEKEINLLNDEKISETTFVTSENSKCLNCIFDEKSNIFMDFA